MTEPDIQHAAAVLVAGRPADALRLLGTHLAQNPDDALALRLVSAALRALGRGQEAVDAAVHAVRLEPEDADSWNALAFAQLEVRDLSNAVQSATHAVHLARTDWAAHTALSAIAGEKEPKGPLTLQAALEAVRLAPNISDTHRSLAVALLRRKKWKQATDELSVALRLDPQDETARQLMAVVTLRKNPARSTVDLAGLTAQSPNDPVTLGTFRAAVGITLGRIHSAAVCGAVLGYQSLRIIDRSIPADLPARLLLGGIAVATLAAVVILVVHAGRTLGASLGPVLRFVVTRDRLIAAWAIIDALAVLPVVISPFLPRSFWAICFAIAGPFVITGAIIRAIRWRSVRRELEKQ